MRYIIDILIAISLLFALAGVVGMIRFRDVFSRMQASTNISTLGVIGVILGAIIYSAVVLHDYPMVVKLVVMGIFYIITNPIAGHAVAKAAYRRGMAKDLELECDKYGEDLENAD